MKCPVAEGIGGQVKRHLPARQDVHGVLQGTVTGIAGDEFKEVPMQMNGMRHHGIVDQVQPDPFIVAKRDWLGTIAQLHAIE